MNIDCGPSTVLGAEDIAINKASPYAHWHYILVILKVIFHDEVFQMCRKYYPTHVPLPIFNDC